MNIFLVVISIVFVTGCFTNTSKRDEANTNADPCRNAQNTFNTISVFEKSDSVQPVNEFNKIVKFLEGKGSAKIQTLDSLNTTIFHNPDVAIKHEIYCTDRYVRQMFIIKNVTSNVCNFKSKIVITDTSLCRPACYPAFSLVQCNFASYKDRDSALKIIKWVHANRTVDPVHKTRMDFENEFVQIVIANHKI